MRTITLTANPDGTFRVASLTNTCELAIGQDLAEKVLIKWTEENMRKSVSFKIIGQTPQGENEVPLLGK